MRTPAKIDPHLNPDHPAYRPENANQQNPGQEERRNINPGRRQNWKEQGDRSENRDSRMKSKGARSGSLGLAKHGRGE